MAYRNRDHHMKSYPEKSSYPNDADKLSQSMRNNSLNGRYQVLDRSYGSERSYATDRASRVYQLPPMHRASEGSLELEQVARISPRALLPLAPPADTKLEYLVYQSPLAQRYRWGTQSMASNFSDYKKHLTWRRLWLYLAKCQRVSLTAKMYP